MSGKLTRWSLQDIDFLEKNAVSMPVTQIADRVGRTATAVRSKAAHLGLPLVEDGSRKPIKFSREDVELCIALHASGMRRKTIAAKMEIPIKTVDSYIYGYRRNKLNNNP